MKILYIVLLLSVFGACQDHPNDKEPITKNKVVSAKIEKTSIVILGTVQDAGSPHIACKKECCKALFNAPDKDRQVVSLGLIDPQHNTKYLFEATPDIASQMKFLKELSGVNSDEIPTAVFLTHAHIGHYTGLMYFGKEAMNAPSVPVYAMPKMQQFLEQNGPWSQLVNNSNISIQPLNHQESISLHPNLKVIPFKVPHRDEYSETVGYKIIGPNKTALFIPDIDKWEKWDRDISQLISQVDYVFIDATFYNGKEINNRDISQVPHPFIIESMSKFDTLADLHKNKIHFIHFNHTNPALNNTSPEAQIIRDKGYHIAQYGQIFDL